MADFKLEPITPTDAIAVLDRRCGLRGQFLRRCHEQR
jgi:hypothetical protein